MHEIGLCDGIVAAVERRAAGRPVTRVRIRAGVRLRLVEASLAHAFALLADGTVAAGAAVELVQEPARVSCPDCGYAGESTDPLTTCPGCGGAGARVTGGDELVLESVTVRGPEPDPAAVAG